MPDEEIINEEQQEEVKEEKPPRAEIRNKDLSEKVIATAKERDEANAKATALEKELEFRKGFSKVASKYEGASDYEDKILEKVNSGYDLEDATVSVLAKAGKLQNPPVKRESPAGGSATTSMGGGTGDLSTMTRAEIDALPPAEKRARLLEIERTEPGTLTQALRSMNMQ